MRDDVTVACITNAPAEPHKQFKDLHRLFRWLRIACYNASILIQRFGLRQDGENKGITLTHALILAAAAGEEGGNMMLAHFDADMAHNVPWCTYHHLVDAVIKRREEAGRSLLGPELLLLLAWATRGRMWRTNWADPQAVNGLTDTFPQFSE